MLAAAVAGDVAAYRRGSVEAHRAYLKAAAGLVAGPCIDLGAQIRYLPNSVFSMTLRVTCAAGSPCCRSR